MVINRVFIILYREVEHAKLLEYDNMNIVKLILNSEPIFKKFKIFF